MNDLPSLDDVDLTETPEEARASLQRYCDQFRAAGETRIVLSPGEAAFWRGVAADARATADFDAVPC